MTSVRRQWAEGVVTLGAWITLPGSVAAELAARQPFAYVCVDTQHGAIDHQRSIAMIQAIELAGSSPIVRVPWNDPAEIGKALDVGAHGIIVPMVNTREQVEAVVRASRYPPEGARSWGPFAVGMRYADHRTWASENIAVIPMIETVEALSNLDAILSVSGVDAIYVGPSDLSISLGLEPANNDGEPAFDEALSSICAACERHGVVAGIHSTGSLAERRRAQGFRMITVATDAVALRDGYARELAAAAGESGPGSATAI